MPSLPVAIQEKSLAVPEGHVLSPKEFLHLGSRAAVDQAFSRLAKAGSLLRIARGIYVAPAQGKAETQTSRTEAIALSIAAKGKVAITASGAVGAKSFGLVSRAPDEVIFLTTGRSKLLTVDAVKASLQHAP
jgi:predicted transcriptional regulator of viral defense system